MAYWLVMRSHELAEELAHYPAPPPPPIPEPATLLLFGLGVLMLGLVARWWHRR